MTSGGPVQMYTLRSGGYPNLRF
ncbi:hypothetical protein U0070_016404 [Myodes glareolus]|uniref:Uncharacterized protein n=1 Tax=Myodes glareolus TaxID=447135 RepID=A0AAW0H777_MYOGA